MKLPADIVARVLERRARFRTEYTRELPYPWEVGEWVIMGSSSYTMPTSRRRMIATTSGVLLRGVEDEGQPIIETATAIARDYLALHYQKPRVAAEQGREVMSLRGAPLYAVPGHYPGAHYVDIKATYFAIMLRAGWNVDYWPERFLIRGRTVEDFPLASHKTARSSLVTMGMLNDISEYIPGQGPRQRKKYNPLINYQLPRLIYDVLHCIADEAVNAGAVYVHTDGYIVPDDRRLARVMGMIADWGLTPRVKESGPAEVYGTASYAVGSIRTKRRLNNAHPITAIDPPDYARWLRTRWVDLCALPHASEVEIC